MKFDFPPVLSSANSDMNKIYDYLFRMSENLNYVMNNIDNGTLAVKVLNGNSTSAGSNSTGSDNDQSSNAKSLMERENALRAFIIKTGEVIKDEMSKIITDLSSQYVAQSDFGSYQENINTVITQTALNTIAQYNYESIINDSDALSEIKTFKTNSESYVKTGILYYDGSSPVTGVAVGEVKTKIDANGKEILNRENLLATFTSSELAFWENEKKVAYFSDDMLYITNAKILDNLYIGNYVFDTTTRGLEIRWEI